MRVTVVCDSAYQLLLVWGLRASGFLSEDVHAIVSIGDGRLRHTLNPIAVDLGAPLFHIEFPASPLLQLIAARRLSQSLPSSLGDVLATTDRLIIFNDGHPGTATVAGHCPEAQVCLIEEGTGTHRTRVGESSIARRLRQLFAPRVNVSGRQGTASWVDELWVSQTDTLIAEQRQKRVLTFNRAAVMDAVQRRWRTRVDVPSTGRPLLVFLGQPLVRDRVLRRSDYEHILSAIGAVVRPFSNRMVQMYKPHPRETRVARSAALALGGDARILDQHVPLELMDFGPRPVFMLALTSGALRNGDDAWHRVSVAPCFPRLISEVGSQSVFAGVRFIDRLSDLTRGLSTFVAESDHERA